MLQKRLLKLTVSTLILGLASQTAMAAEFCRLANAAVNKSQNIVALNHQLKASKERIFQANNMNGPKLNLLANLSAYTERQGNMDIQADGTISVDYNQTIFDNGVSEAMTRQAETNKKIAALDVRNATKQAIYDLSKLYIEFLFNHESLKLHHENMATVNQQLANVKDRFEASAATQQEVSIVESSVRQAMSALLQAKSKLLLTRVKILSLTNKKPSGSDHMFLLKLLKVAPKTQKAALNFAKRNSIQIDQSKLAIDVAADEVLVKEAEMGPKLSLNGKLGFGRVDEQTGGAGQVGLTFSMPLYSSGVEQSRVREARAMLAAARARHAYSVELSSQQVNAAFEISKNIEQTVKILPEAIAAEEEAIASLEESIASSFIPIKDLLLAKHSLFQLKKGLVELKFERYTSNLELMNNVGYLNNIAKLKKSGICR